MVARWNVAVVDEALGLSVDLGEVIETIAMDFNTQITSLEGCTSYCGQSKELTPQLFTSNSKFRGGD